MKKVLVIFKSQKMSDTPLPTMKTPAYKIIFRSILKKSWQAGEVPTDCKRGNITSVLKKGKKGRHGELETHESHLGGWQSHGAGPPGSYARI